MTLAPPTETGPGPEPLVSGDDALGEDLAGVPGLSVEILTITGLPLYPAVEDVCRRDPVARTHWEAQAGQLVSWRGAGVVLLQGLLAEDVHVRKAWRADTPRGEPPYATFAEWAERCLGLDKTQVSKARTIARVLRLQAGLPASVICRATDVTALYRVATRAKRLFAKATTALERAVALDTVRQLLDGQQGEGRLSRSDLTAEMDARGVPKEATCRHAVWWCTFLGAPCPPTGCARCAGNGGGV